MNEKKCKKMRSYTKSFIEMGQLDPGLFRKVYRSIKKGVRNEAKLARFGATSNQLVERTPLIHKEQNHDSNN